MIHKTKYLSYVGEVWQSEPNGTIPGFWNYKITYEDGSRASREDWAVTMEQAKKFVRSDLVVLCIRGNRPIPKRLTWTEEPE